MKDGKLTISRVSFSTRLDAIHIRLQDCKSSIEFVEIEISLKEFANAITGFACRPVKFTLRNVENVSKKFEHKTVKICVPIGIDITPELATVNIISADPDLLTWGYEFSDFKNHHNRSPHTDPKLAWYSVSFWRWVEDSNG